MEAEREKQQGKTRVLTEVQDVDPVHFRGQWNSAQAPQSTPVSLGCSLCAAVSWIWFLWLITIEPT